MLSLKGKIFFLSALSLILISCEKEKQDERDEFFKMSFDERGKIFDFEERLTMNGSPAIVSVEIPKAAVSEWNTLEHYLYYANDFYLTYFQVNATWGDVNLFRTSAGKLDTAALITLPYFNPGSYNADWYEPYKVKCDGKTNILNAMNVESNWEAITSYTINVAAQTVSFRTTDLNAAYVLADHK
jgi:hypothetical protein